jgi:GT2 family glycosyltransferase
MIGSLLNNDSINIKDIREYIMKMMDHYKNTEAIATKHVGAYTTLRDSIHYFKDDDEYIDRAMKFFGDDRYGIIDFFNFVQPDNDKLKKMLVAVKPEIRKDLISGLIDNDKIVAVPDWIYWLWNQNLPANQLNIHILRQLFIKAREGEGIVFTEKAAGAFLDTIYKNTMNGQAEALLYKEDVAFIYKKFPSLDPFKYSKQVAEVRLREAAKRKTLLGRRF